MHVQPQLVLLQKTLLNIEGLGRQLYPELDLWQTAKPFLEEWFHERLGPKAKIEKIIKQFPEFAEQFPQIPSLLYKALDNAAHAQQNAEAQQRELALLRRQMDKNHRTTVWAMIISAAVISVAVLFQ
jgi:ubiquinone biosynthesis protein